MITLKIVTLAYVVVGVLSSGMIVGWFLKKKYGDQATAAKALETSVQDAVSAVKPVESSVKSTLGNL